MGVAAALTVPEDDMFIGKKVRWFSILAASITFCLPAATPQPIANAAPANGGTPSLGGTINGKSGPAKARVWILGVGNNGPGLARKAEITGVTLLQTSGPACSPVVTTQFPLLVGNIPPQKVVKASITIDFTGCDTKAIFKVTAAESANSGSATGSIVRLNQFQ